MGAYIHYRRNPFDVSIRPPIIPHCSRPPNNLESGCMGQCERHSAECYIECRDYNNGTPDPNPDQCGIIIPDTPDVEPPPCPSSVENDCESLIDNLGPEWDTCKSDTDSVTEIKEVCKLEACLWIDDPDEIEMIQQVHKGKD